MTDFETEIKADNIEDRNEPIEQMEPLLINESSKHRSQLTDLAIELTKLSAGFRHSLPEGIVTALSALVRSMNCYYSNLIEGHDTHPVDIEKALKNDYSQEPEKRNLQKEAVAHISVQKWIDDGGLKESPVTQNNILEIHCRFCELLPDDMLSNTYIDTQQSVTMQPGQYRHLDVKVGRHVPISPGAIPRFMTRFEDGYSKLGKTDTIFSVATAHHRLLWIHPFLDGMVV